MEDNPYNMRDQLRKIIEEQRREIQKPPSPPMPSAGLRGIIREQQPPTPSRPLGVDDFIDTLTQRITPPHLLRKASATPPKKPVKLIGTVKSKATLRLGLAPITPSTGKVAAVERMIADIDDMLSNTLEVSATRSVPGVLDISLTGGKVIESAVLYVDIRNSTSITERHPNDIAAKIYKSFLYAMVRIARHNQKGHVRGFAGDRIMVVFDNQEINGADRAVECAVWMQSMVEQILSPRLARYCQHPIECGIGIDYSKIVAVRAGTKGYDNNNAIWAGKAANVASKLSDKAKGSEIIISKRTKNAMSPEGQKRFRIDQWKPFISIATSAIGSYSVAPSSLRYKLR